MEIRAARERRERGEQLADEAERLSGSLHEFVMAAWPLVPRMNPYIDTWHIRTLCEHVQAWYDREILRLLVTLPPGYVKSGIASVFGPAWRWTHDPSERFVSASHADDLSTRDTRRSRELMQTEWYRARWHEWEFSRDENLKTRYSNDQGGSRVRTHVEGGTGDRGSALILDDPHNAKEAYSELQLQSAINWYGDTWASRLDDLVGDRGIKMVVGQRISEKDLIGHLLTADEDAGRWTHLCLPVRYEAKHQFVYPEKVKLPSGRVLQGDVRKREGELLAPEFMDEEILADRTADMTAQVFAAQYLQRPAPAEGNLLKRALWRYYPPEWSFYAPRGLMDKEALPVFSQIVTSWDTSVKDRAHSDFVSGQVWGVERPNPANRWLLRLWHGRAALNETIDAMLALHAWVEEHWSCPQYVVIETAANGADAIAEIRGRVQGVVDMKAIGSKVQRAESAQPALAGRNCFLPGYANEMGTDYDARTPQAVQSFVEELAVFDQGTHDDQVDAWSQMVNYTRKHGSRTGTMSVTRARKPRPAALPR